MGIRSKLANPCAIASANAIGLLDLQYPNTPICSAGALVDCRRRLRIVSTVYSVLAMIGLERVATWLILPVVICLSQRLSHACLSINCLYCETANGSLNQL
jgi:hypothetical protein